MSTKQKIGLIFAIILFLIGIGISFYLNILGVWSDLEGMSFWGYPESVTFDRSLETDARLGMLNCPVVISNNETSLVHFQVENPKDFEIKPELQIFISDPDEDENISRHQEILVLGPNETQEITWEVTPANILNGRAVYARVYLHQSQYHPPSLTRHCGIFVRQIGNLNGSQILLGGLGTSFLLILISLLLWWFFSTPYMKRSRRVLNRMVAFSLFLLINALTVLLGWQLPAIILLVLSILLAFSIIENVAIETFVIPRKD